LRFLIFSLLKSFQLTLVEQGDLFQDSFTGIAGPTGGSKEKPVGLVWIGIGLPKNKYKAYKFIFSGDRQTIRERAVQTGFGLLRQEIIKNEK